jgi:hypothetical protein
MAYFPKPEDDEQESPTTAGTSAIAPAAAPQAAPQAAPAPAAPTGSGRFVNFARFLDANRGAAQQTAGRVAQGVERLGGEARAARTQAQSEFDQQPGAASLSGVAGYGAAQRTANAAQDAANATATGGGLGALMQRPGYGSGLRRLDQALVGAEGAQRFSGLRDKYGGLARDLDSANAESAKVGEQRSADAAAAEQAAADQKRGDEIWQAVRRNPELEHQKYIEAKFGAGAWDLYMDARRRNWNYREKR